MRVQNDQDLRAKRAKGKTTRYETTRGKRESEIQHHDSFISQILDTFFFRSP